MEDLVDSSRFARFDGQSLSKKIQFEGERFVQRNAKAVAELRALPGVWEEFYAITIQRRFESPSLKALLTRTGESLLD